MPDHYFAVFFRGRKPDDALYYEGDLLEVVRRAVDVTRGSPGVFRVKLYAADGGRDRLVGSVDPHGEVSLRTPSEDRAQRRGGLHRFSA